MSVHPSPDFNRMLMALRRAQPDRVPLAELWIDQVVMEAYLGRPIGSHDTGVDYDLEAEIEFWHRAGYDYIHIEPRYFFPKKSGCRPTPDEDAGLLTSWAEFNDYPWPTIEQVDFSDLVRAPDYLPEGMAIIAGTSGIFEEVWMIMGFETMCLKVYEQLDLVTAMFQRVGSIVLEIIKRAASFDCVGAMWISDDIAYANGLFLDPEIYRRLLFPWYRRMKSICCERNLPFLYHTDGLLWPVMSDLIKVGFDTLQPIEPKAMDIQEVKQKVGDHFCLIGNVDVDYPLSRGTPAEVEEAVRYLIEAVAPKGGYCLGSSNTVPSYVPVENFVAMIEACRK